MTNASLRLFGSALPFSTALAMALSLSLGFAEDAPGAAAKPAGGDVGKVAISADANSHCAKAKADGPKGAEMNCDKDHSQGDHSKGAKGAGHAKPGAMKGEAADTEITAEGMGDCPKGSKCPKGMDCSKHAHGMKHKAGAAEAPATGGAATPAAKPADAEKDTAHPG